MFKKYTTFTLMKKRRTIFLNIILFLFVVLYSGIAAHSILDTQTAYMELSPVNDNNENRLCSNTDSPDNDQIDQVSLSDLSELPECQKNGLSSMPVLNILFFSVWQPPKVF